jgi:hypothetical protein
VITKNTPNPLDEKDFDITDYYSNMSDEQFNSILIEIYN